MIVKASTSHPVSSNKEDVILMISDHHSGYGQTSTRSILTSFNPTSYPQWRGNLQMIASKLCGNSFTPSSQHHSITSINLCPTTSAPITAAGTAHKYYVYPAPATSNTAPRQWSPYCGLRRNENMTLVTFGKLSRDPYHWVSDSTPHLWAYAQAQYPLALGNCYALHPTLWYTVKGVRLCGKSNACWPSQVGAQTRSMTWSHVPPGINGLRWGRASVACDRKSARLSAMCR